MRLIPLLADLIADGFGDNRLDIGLDNWDVNNLYEALLETDDPGPDLETDWVADIDINGVVALVELDPVTHLRRDHPPAYTRPSEEA